MSWPLMWRRNGVDRARYEQVIDQRDDARGEAARHVCKIVELCGDNDRLNEQLAAARRELARYKGARTVPEVLEEHDVHRKALADAIHAGWHLNWQQLIDTARRTYEGAAEWRADFEEEKKRADHLQQRLDQATGLDDPAIAAGAAWQDRREKKMRFDK